MPTQDPATCAKTNKVAYLYGLPSQQVAVVGFLEAGECVEVIGRTEAGDWYQLNMLQVWIPAQDVDRAPSVPIIPVAVPTPRATDTPWPTNTPAPALIIQPTHTPLPTPVVAAQPLAPTCMEMETAHDTMTDAQWKNFRKTHAGKWIQGWVGTIREVDGKGFLDTGYTFSIDIPPDCSLYYHSKSEQEALSYSAGQMVVIDGQIGDFYSFLGSISISMETETVTLRPLQ